MATIDDPDASITLDAVLAAERQWFRSEPAAAAPPGPDGDAARSEDGNAPLQDIPLSAVCLSGGGIRSATFSLGVLQGLAAKGLLDQFHYLSTVSGGGYIGSWLSSWIMRDGMPKVMAALRQPVADMEPQPIQRLRAYSNYLSPMWGLSADFLSLVAIFVRNLAVHWGVVLPLLAAVMLLPRLQLAALGTPKAAVWPWILNGALPLAVVLLLVTIAYFAADLPGDPSTAKEPKNRFVVACFAPLLAASFLFSWVLCWQPDMLGASWHRAVVGVALVHLVAALAGMVWRKYRGLQPRPRKKARNLVLDILYVAVSGAVGGLLLYAIAVKAGELRGTKEGLRLLATVGVPALLFNFWVGVTCYAGLASRITTEEDREWWARSAGWWLGASVVWLLASMLVIYVPVWLLKLWWLQTPAGPQALGVSAALVGALTGAAGYWSKNGALVKKSAKTFLQATRVRLLDAAALVSVVALAIAMSFAMSCTLRATNTKLGEEVHKRHRDQTDMAKYAAASAAYAAYASPGPPAAPPAPAPLATSAVPGTPGAGPAEPLPYVAPLAARAAAGYDTVLDAARPLRILSLALALVAFGALASWVIGINAFSLHSMYGNRLARAYLGASNGQRRAHWFTGFDPLDNPKFSGVLREKGQEGVLRKERRLFPVINIALNLVQASRDRLEWQQRKAATFTMSPLHCGSPVLGFAPTAQYGDDQGGMSLGRAMAISGAAASPNMGYHSSKLVAFVMTFLNVRLGWWMPNPVGRNRSLWSKREPRLGLEALYAEGIVGATAERNFVYLSDGGHFENLGIYEMVRRRCARILAVDATSDPGYQFGDLQSAIRKIRIDFGIPITFAEPLPSPARALETGRRIAIGYIDYAAVDPGAPRGILVYVKPALNGKDPLDVASYAAANREPGKEFPHQSTGDQFFDEAQFESYRMLGQSIVMQDFPGHGAWPELASPRVSQRPVRSPPADQPAGRPA